MSRADAPTRSAALDAAAVAAADALALIADQAHRAGQASLHDAAARALDTLPRRAGPELRARHLAPATAARALCAGCPVIDRCRTWVDAEPWFSGVAAGRLFVNGGAIGVATNTTTPRRTA